LLSEYLSPSEAATRRRHGLWGLGILLLAAIVVVGAIILFTGGHTGRSRDNGTTVYGRSVINGAPPSTRPSSKPSSATPATHSRSRSSSPEGSSGGASAAADSPCTGSKPCAVKVDPMELTDAINAMRRKHNLDPVTGSTSANADACAVGRGSGPGCVPHYLYTHVTTPTGSALTDRVKSVNESWLLDASTTRIEIGLARDPGNAGYECAVLKFP
jgi:hypothetical protein